MTMLAGAPTLSAAELRAKLGAVSPSVDHALRTLLTEHLVLSDDDPSLPTTRFRLAGSLEETRELLAAGLRVGVARVLVEPYARQILRELCAAPSDARSAKQVAKRLHIDVETVGLRLERLHEAGVVTLSQANRWSVSPDYHPFVASPDEAA